jgi:hypothetical protein
LPRYSKAALKLRDNHLLIGNRPANAFFDCDHPAAARPAAIITFFISSSDNFPSTRESLPAPRHPAHQVVAPIHR